jgi:hypothetical protein
MVIGQGVFQLDELPPCELWPSQQAFDEGVALLDMFAPLLAKADRVITFNGRPIRSKPTAPTIGSCAPIVD